MADDIAMEIEQILAQAWEKFLDYYNENAPKYLESWQPELKRKEAKESHWICWNEYDLMFHVGRFFRDILKERKDEKFSNIEIHFEKNINSANFKGYEFENRLKELNKNLKPKVDIIIAYENKNSRLLLCAEVKYFHGASEHYGEEPVKKITDDIKKLKAIRHYEISQRVVFILFDDYYWFANEKKAKDIEDELGKIKEDEKIGVLFCNSKAKMGSVL